MADSAKAYLKKRAAARPSPSVVGVTTPRDKWISHVADRQRAKRSGVILSEAKNLALHQVLRFAPDDNCCSYLNPL